MSAIAERLSRVVVGTPVQYLNLTLFPLLAEGPAQPGYRLLDEALNLGTARVTEVSEGGSVPELCFVNQGDLPVLLLDGDELIGAKQNRILNLTVLAPAHQTIVIPVSCVEADRWHADTAEFGSARRTHFAAGRARKAADVSESLRRRGSRESDQGAVWRDIEERSQRMKVSSPTRAAAALYEGHRATLDDYRAAFAAQSSQCGALFAINGRLAGLDLFDSPTALSAALGKLVESYALDAIDAADRPPAAAPEAPHPWLKAIAKADVERFAALGEGEDWRLLGNGLAGGALVKDEKLIHLCAFRMAGSDDRDDAPDPEDRNRLRLALDTDRRLICNTGRSERYLHLQLRAPRATQERAPIDLALVLDRSGSMGGDKWPRACEAALAAIERLDSRDRVALVVFDDRIDTLLPLTRAGTETRQAAARALAGVGPRGTTNLGDGWLTACGLIGREASEGRLRRCFVLTDGQANVGMTEPADLAKHAVELLQFGIRTSTFGVGDDYNEALLGTLADAGGGMFHDIASAAEIPDIIGQELGDALEVVCAAPLVHISWQADLKVKVLGPWRAAPADHALTIQPGDLVSSQVLDLLVSVRFPAGDPNVDCPLQVRVSEGEHALAEDEFHWTWVDDATRKAQPRQTQVERRVADYLAHQARYDAAAANRGGDLKGARHTLRTAARSIRHYGAATHEVLEVASALESEVERHRRAFGSREAKAEVYASGNALRNREASGARRRNNEAVTEPRLQYLPCQNSPEQAERARQLRNIPRQQTAAMGQETMTALMTGRYTTASGQTVYWRADVQAAIHAKRSLPPDAPLPATPPARFSSTRIQVTNESTLEAAQRLQETGLKVLALNFANGIEPGGGFLQGSRGQESVLCRSSALYATQEGDAMYQAHQTRPLPDSTDWAILSPDVPVFRSDDGRLLDRPWPLSILSCAAPYAPKLGHDVASDLMQSRIRRVLAIARAFGYTGLVLGAWGCGTYGNDPGRVAAIFHAAIQEQAGAFAEVVFAIIDGSTERRFLAPFAAQFMDR